MHWRHVEVPRQDPVLPAGVEPLASHVEAPPELDRRLRQTGIVAGREQGHKLQPQLKPGQRLVTRAGDLWRWDGYHGRGRRRGACRATPRRAQPAFVAGAGGSRGAHRRDGDRRRPSARPSKRSPPRAPRSSGCASSAARRRACWRKRAKASPPSSARRARPKASSPPSPGHARAPRKSLSSPRTCWPRPSRLSPRSPPPRIWSRPSPLPRPRRMRAAWTWRKRARRCPTSNASAGRAPTAGPPSASSASAGRRARPAPSSRSLRSKSRLAEAQSELEGLADVPAMIAEQRDKLMSALSEAERGRQIAADALAEADTALKAGVQALRAAQGAVAEAREGRARTEARLEGARTRRQDVSRQIREALGIAPEGCLALAEIQPGAYLPPLADVERKLPSLKADRERLGGVNLGADEELQALSIQAAGPRHREGRRGERHRQAARRHRPAQSRGAQAAAGSLRGRQRPLRQAVHDAVRRRRGAPRNDRGRGSAGRRPGDHRQAARQEAGDAVAALGRRAVADRACR